MRNLINKLYKIIIAKETWAILGVLSLFAALAGGLHSFAILFSFSIFSLVCGFILFTILFFED